MSAVFARLVMVAAFAASLALALYAYSTLA